MFGLVIIRYIPLSDNEKKTTRLMHLMSSWNLEWNRSLFCSKENELSIIQQIASTKFLQFGHAKLMKRLENIKLFFGIIIYI